MNFPLLVCRFPLYGHCGAELPSTQITASSPLSSISSRENMLISLQTKECYTGAFLHRNNGGRIFTLGEHEALKADAAGKSGWDRVLHRDTGQGIQRNFLLKLWKNC